MNTCIELLFKEQKFQNCLHTEIKSRIPYRFETRKMCPAKNAMFEITAVRTFQDDSGMIGKAKISTIQINEFTIKENKIEMKLFYPFESAGVNCVFKRTKGKIRLVKMDFYEI